MRLVMKQGNGTLEHGAAVVVAERVKQLKPKFKKWSGQALKKCIGDYWRSRFPGSRHWRSDLVKANASGSVSISVPGVSRAFHDVDIYPKRGDWLVLPAIARRLTGMNSSFSNQRFKILPFFRPKHHNVLMQKEGKDTAVLAAVLSKHVHQKKDESILPSVQRIARAVIAKFKQMAGK